MKRTKRSTKMYNTRAKVVIAVAFVMCLTRGRVGEFRIPLSDMRGLLLSPLSIAKLSPGSTKMHFSEYFTFSAGKPSDSPYQKFLDPPLVLLAAVKISFQSLNKINAITYRCHQILLVRMKEDIQTDPDPQVLSTLHRYQPQMSHKLAVRGRR